MDFMRKEKGGMKREGKLEKENSSEKKRIGERVKEIKEIIGIL